MPDVSTPPKCLSEFIAAIRLPGGSQPLSDADWDRCADILEVQVLRPLAGLSEVAAVMDGYCQGLDASNTESESFVAEELRRLVLGPLCEATGYEPRDIAQEAVDAREGPGGDWDPTDYRNITG